MTLHIIGIEANGTVGLLQGVFSDAEFADLPYVHEWGCLPDRYTCFYLESVDDPEWETLAKLPFAYEPDPIAGMKPIEAYYALYREYLGRAEREHKE